MLDETEGNVATVDLPYAYNRQPFYKKFLIVAAGPFSNLVFAFLIYWLLFVVGFITLVPIIGKISPNSIAANAGLKPQQEITAVDHKPSQTWMTIIVHLLARSGETSSLNMQVQDNNQTKTINLNLATWKMDDLKPDPLASLGIIPYEPIIPPIINKILIDGPAARSNLKIGDEIVAINKKKIGDWYDMMEMISTHPKEKLTFTIKRNRQILDFPIVIGMKTSFFMSKHGFLGVSPKFEYPKKLLRLNKYSPIMAMQHAYQDTVTFVHLNFIILGKMLTGKISFHSLGGPITIFESAGNALNLGIISFLSFLAFLSISIGVINILPIPGLDGGHLLIQIIEAVTGRTMSVNAQVLLFRLGFILLIVVMFQALMNDILRIW